MSPARMAALFNNAFARLKFAMRIRHGMPSSAAPKKMIKTLMFVLEAYRVTPPAGGGIPAVKKRALVKYSQKTCIPSGSTDRTGQIYL